MTTTPRLYKCSICGESSGKYTDSTGLYKYDGPFYSVTTVNDHKRLVHYEEWQAAHASSRVVSRRGDDYDMGLTYQASPYEWGVAYVRHPTAEALALIERREQVLESAKVFLEEAKAAAWESGVPVKIEEVEAARAAGEVTV